MNKNSLNMVTLVGRVGSEPKTFKVGSTTKTFVNIATTESVKSNGAYVDRTTWHSCSAFAPMGESLAKLLKKGDLVMVTGKISNYEAEDKSSGFKYTKTEIVIGECQLLARSNNGAATSKPATSQTTQTQKSEEFDDFI